MKNILAALDNPLDLKLLFRASEHKFSAYEFHKYCDNIANTFVIAKTNYSKIISGFTPLKWDSNSSYKEDSSMKSFLYQVDNNQKYTLIP
jgi:hypothetical protein